MDASSANSTMASASPDESPYLHTTSPQAVLMQVLALITIIMNFPCLLWHIEKRTMPSSVMIGWVMINNFSSMLNAFIWPTDDLTTFWHGIGFCDVMTRLDLMGQMAKIGCALCILKTLAASVDSKRLVISGRGGIGQKILEYGLCLGLPILNCVGQFIVSDRRYYIQAIQGCYPSMDSTWLTVVLVESWMPILCYISAYYGGLIIIRIRKCSKDINSVLNNQGTTKTQFTRLLILSGIFILGFLPYSTYMLVNWLTPPFNDADLSRIHNPKTWNTILLEKSFGQVSIDRWTRIIEGFVVFLTFGFGRDIKGTYTKIMSTLGVSTVYNSVTSSFTARRRRSPSNSTTTPRKNSHFAGKPTRTSGFGNLKHLSKQLLCKLGGSTLGSGATHTDNDTVLGTLEPVGSPAQKSTFATDVAPLSPASPKYRPTGLADKDLFDNDDDDIEAAPVVKSIASPARTVASLAATVVPEHNAEIVTTHDAHQFEQAAQSQSDSHSQSRFFAQQRGSRSTFWQRLHGYVGAMGPRPAANMGVLVTRTATVSREPAPQMSDLDAMRSRDYEAHVVANLV